MDYRSGVVGSSLTCSRYRRKCSQYYSKDFASDRLGLGMVCLEGLGLGQASN